MKVWKNLGPLAKFIVFLSFLVPLVYILWGFLEGYGFLGREVKQVKTLDATDSETGALLASAPKNIKTVGLKFTGLPSSTEPYTEGGKIIIMAGIMWNGASGINYANGGVYTMKSSLFAEQGLRVKLVRQDDYSLLKDGMVKFSMTNNPSDGYAYIWYMGDNHAAFITDLNNRLMQVNPSFRAEGIVISGYSYGEDKFMGPFEWKLEPQKARGGLCAVVLFDGDHNLVIKWASDNGVPINPDPTTYCYEALNFAGTDDFMKAARMFGQAVNRPVVTIDENGKTHKTGETVTAKINSVGTWTPGDKLAAESADPFLVNIYSTRENVHQMPCLLVGLNKYMEKNIDETKRIITAIVRAGDQIKTYGQAFDRAMAANAEVFGHEDADYWKRLFNGEKWTNKDGRMVEFGGSRACNLAENLEALGAGENSRNTFKSSYELFGNFMATLYPEELASFPPYSEAVNTSYLSQVYSQERRISTTGEITSAKEPVYPQGSISERVSGRNYSIEFETGSDVITPASRVILEGLFNDLNTNDLRIAIAGHTDNTGSDEINIPLSQRRAMAVKSWLMNKSFSSFPVARFEKVQGFGSTKPLNQATEDTWQGRKKNRRVEIVTGI